MTNKPVDPAFDAKLKAHNASAYSYRQFLEAAITEMTGFVLTDNAAGVAACRAKAHDMLDGVMDANQRMFVEAREVDKKR